MRSLDIICPAFREQKGIGRFHERPPALLDGLAGRLAPSLDSTGEIFAAIARADANVEGHRHKDKDAGSVSLAADREGQK